MSFEKFGILTILTNSCKISYINCPFLSTCIQEIPLALFLLFQFYPWSIFLSPFSVLFKKLILIFQYYTYSYTYGHTLSFVFKSSISLIWWFENVMMQYLNTSTVSYDKKISMERLFKSFNQNWQAWHI